MEKNEENEREIETFKRLIKQLSHWNIASQLKALESTYTVELCLHGGKETYTVRNKTSNDCKYFIVVFFQEVAMENTLDGCF